MREENFYSHLSVTDWKVREFLNKVHHMENKGTYTMGELCELKSLLNGVVEEKKEDIHSVGEKIFLGTWMEKSMEECTTYGNWNVNKRRMENYWKNKEELKMKRQTLFTKFPCLILVCDRTIVYVHETFMRDGHRYMRYSTRAKGNSQPGIDHCTTVDNFMRSRRFKII